MSHWLKYYVKSMRLYYCFVTLTAGYAGVVASRQESSWVQHIIWGTILFCSWGVNQIINDYLNLKEDSINAPSRPMVTGQLPARKAVLLSSSLIAAILGYCAVVNMGSAIPMLAGVLLNILYARAKAFGWLGNLSFGFMIACCPWFGYVISGGGVWDFFINCGTIWLAIAAFNMVMTYFTYFKDAQGDAEAGQKTLIVRLGAKRAAYWGVWLSVIPAVVLLSFPFNLWYGLGAFIGAGLFLLTGYLFSKNYSGDKAYHQLGYNFAALCACQAALVSLAFPLAGFIMCVAGVAGVLGIMKLWYGNAKE